jgi:hypothetical protein
MARYCKKKINQGQIFFPQEVCEKWFNKIKKFIESPRLIVFFFNDYNIFLPPILFRGDRDRKYDFCPWLTFHNNHKKIESKPI